MHNFSSLSHSFNVDICVQYGMEEAVLIHHFQYWIKHNKSMNRNLHEGRFWTYQTLEEIAAYFPYWTPQKVRRYIDSLVRQEVLIKGNFNKTPFDRTVWYAFKDEEIFLNSENSNNSYVGRKCQMDMSNAPNPNLDFATPIPDTKTYTKTEKEPRPSASCSHPEAGNVTSLLIESIKKTKPDLKDPAFMAWHDVIERMLRIDKRCLETVKKLLQWLPTNEFWSKNILSAESFRKQFDRLELEMGKMPLNRVSDDLKFIRKLEAREDITKNAKINIGSDYIEFATMRNSYFKAGEPAFQEKVINCLRKIPMPKKSE